MSKEPTLAAKLADISKEIGFIEFDSQNSYHGYQYASAALIIRKLNHALSTRGVVAYVSRSTATFNGDLAIVNLELTYKDAISGETMYVQGTGSAKDSGDKAIMKAATAAYKYAISHSLTLSWGAEDPEDDFFTDAMAQIRDSTTDASLRGVVDALKGRFSKGSRQYKQLLAMYKKRKTEIDNGKSKVENKAQG